MIGSDPVNQAVSTTGSGDASMETITTDACNFFTPRGHDKFYREGEKFLTNILDIEPPLISSMDGPARLYSEYVLLGDIVLAITSTVFQDKPHVEFGVVSANKLLARAREIGDRLAEPPPLRAWGTRITLIQKLRWVIEGGVGRGVASEGFSAQWRHKGPLPAPT